MIVFRVGSLEYSKDLSGNGAKLAGGRWNPIGTSCIYTAASRALCTIEYSAHKNLYKIPVALTTTLYNIPDDKITIFQIKDLPGNWRAWPYEDESQQFGAKYLTVDGPLILGFPSAMIPQEFNYVLNPHHPKFEDIKIDAVESYLFDIRIKLSPDK